MIAGIDEDPANAPVIKSWASGFWEALRPHATGGSYQNMMMVEGDEGVKAVYGDHFDRLARIKAHYDSANLFHVNQNIVPKA